MRSFLNVLRGGRGRGEPGKEEMKRQDFAHDLKLKPHSQLLGSLCGTRESWLCYHWFTRQRHSLHCNTEPFVDHSGIFRRIDGQNPQPWRTLQSKAGSQPAAVGFAPGDALLFVFSFELWPHLTLITHTSFFGVFFWICAYLSFWIFVPCSSDRCVAVWPAVLE